MKLFFSDMKRGLTEASFLVAILIGLVCVGIPFVLNLSIMDGTALLIRTNSQMLPFIAPLLCAIPFSNMWMLEKDCGFRKLVEIKRRRSGYFFVRWITNALIGGISLCIPIIFVLIITSVIRSFSKVEDVLFLIMQNFVFGVAFSSFAFGLCFVNIKRYIPLIAPQLIYMLCTYAFGHLGLNDYYPPVMFSKFILIENFVPINYSIVIGILTISPVTFYFQSLLLAKWRLRYEF